MVLLQSKYSVDRGGGGGGCCFFRRDGAEKCNGLPSCAHKARRTRPQAVDVEENRDLQVVRSGNGGFNASNNPSDSRGAAFRGLSLGMCGCDVNLGVSHLNQHRRTR